MVPYLGNDCSSEGRGVHYFRKSHLPLVPSEDDGQGLDELFSDHAHGQTRGLQKTWH